MFHRYSIYNANNIIGPFLAKSFCSTISPWIVLTDALEPFRAKGIDNDTQLLPYLQEKRADNMFDIRLQVQLTPKDGKPTVISNSSGKYLLFSFPQMLAHHTINGCNMRTGDFLGKSS